MELIFSEPFSYKDFVVTKKKEANHPGIYIWGFKNDGKFVPYYVGKSEGSIYNRIISHREKILNANTYTIFEESFYNNLSKHLEKLPKVAKPYKNLLVAGSYFKNMILYCNNQDFLNERFKNQVSDKSILKKNCSSQNIDKKLLVGSIPPIQKTIDKIFHQDNLCIAYAEPLKINSTEKKAFKSNIRDAETYTKFKLPNPVISDSGSLTDEIQNKFEIKLTY